MGKQRTTPIGRAVMGYRHEAFTDALRGQIELYMRGGGALLISGCYALSDVWQSPLAEDDDRAWVRSVLGVEYAGQSYRGGGIVRSKPRTLRRKGFEVRFNQLLGAECYAVEACDIITPASDDAHSIMHYDTTEHSAAVVRRTERGVTMFLGFPIETIIDEYERDMLMRNILKQILKD